MPLQFTFILFFALIVLGLLARFFNNTQSRSVQLRDSSLFFLSCVLTILAVSLLCLAISPQSSNVNWLSSLLQLFSNFSYIQLKNQDWLVFSSVIDNLHENPNFPIYPSLISPDGLSFSHPPTAFLVFDFLKSNTVFEWATIFNVLNFVLVFIGLGFTWICYRLYSGEGLANFVIEQIGDVKRFGHLLLMLLLVIAFYPVLEVILDGKIILWSVWLVAWSLLAYSLEKKTLSGVLIGFAATLNPIWSLMLIWGVIRKQWQLFLASFIVLSICIILVVHLYGYALWLNYFNLIEMQYLQMRNGYIMSALVLFLLLIFFWRYRALQSSVDYSLTLTALSMAWILFTGENDFVTLPAFMLFAHYAIKYELWKRQTHFYLLLMLMLLNGQFLLLIESFTMTVLYPQQFTLVGLVVLLYGQHKLFSQHKVKSS